MQNFAMRGGPITRAVMSPLLSRSNFFSSPSDATSAAEEVDEDAEASTISASWISLSLESSPPVVMKRAGSTLDRNRGDNWAVLPRLTLTEHWLRLSTCCCCEETENAEHDATRDAAVAVATSRDGLVMVADLGCYMRSNGYVVGQVHTCISFQDAR